MRIALIAPLVTPIGAAHVGGAQAVVADLARALAARSHDVVVYAARASAIAGVTLAGVDVDSTALRGDLFRDGVEATPSPAMVDAYRAVYSHVRRARFEMVHNHGFDAPAVSVAAEFQISVLHTLHLPPDRVMAGAINSARRQPASAWCAAVSGSHAVAWGQLVRVDAVLRNGVPVAEIPFPALPRSGAVIAARFSPEKGIDAGVLAARLAGWKVDVYGTPYDFEYERSLRERWADDPSVRFLAPVRRSELWQALGRAAAVLCLSRWDEPFGMVAAEAQAAGTPVIASRRGGFVEVVHDGVTGHLVPTADVEAAAAALGAVAALSPADCRRHAQRSLSLDGAVAAHQELYARLAPQQ
jgi:glycosyltransferase involved in cell wall biosynthesis